MLIERHPGRDNTWRVPLLPAVAGVVCAELVVASLASVGLAWIALAICVGAMVAYLTLRWPVAAAFALLGWIALEKAIEPHLPIDPTVVDGYGNNALVAALLWTLLLNLMRQRIPLLTLREIGLPLIVFVALGVVSGAINAVPWHTTELGILSTTHSMIIFLVLVNLGLRGRHVLVAASIFFGFMAVNGIVALLQIAPSSPAWRLAAAPPIAENSGFVRVMGLFEWPNSLADYIAIALPLGLMPALFGGIHGRLRTLTLYVAGPIMLGALFLSGSREAWGAVLVATLFLGLTVERRLLDAFLRVLLPGLVVAALLYQPFLSRLGDTFQATGRVRFFQASLPLIEGHPWLGVGPGQFGGHVALLTNSPIYMQYDLTELFSEISTQQIDMFWTHLVAESGVLGCAAYLAAFVFCFVRGRRAYRAAVEPRRKAMLLGLLYAIPIAIFVSFVSPFLEATNSATLFWGLMGMLSALAGAEASATSEEPTADGG